MLQLYEYAHGSSQCVIKMTEKLYAVPFVSDVSLEKMPDDYELPNEQTFKEEIPPLFKISESVDYLNYSQLKELREEGDIYEELGQIINRQSAKINQLLIFTLAQNMDKFNLYKTMRVSGNQVIIRDKEQFKVGQIVRVKLFLIEYCTIVYCYGQVASSEVDEEGLYITDVQFNLIDENDRERIVRATFDIQRTQKKARDLASARKESGD